LSSAVMSDLEQLPAYKPAERSSIPGAGRGTLRIAPIW
jgi:hypothetical protein